MDFVPIVNGLTANAAAAGEIASAEFGPLVDFIKTNAVAMITFGILMAVVYGFVRRIWARLSRTIEDTMFSNWRLALLGATALVLSLASGWTTWDGMKNFTGEPTLSLMITFGIQGVMLIVAWLIGETFATGMHQRAEERAKHWAGIFGGIIAAAVIVISVVALFYLGSISITSEVALFGTVGIALIALVAFLQWDLLQPYLQSSRIIMRNGVLWVMFLGCMATSVFFSFDSLFSTIFPAGERVRAAQLRAQNQVSGIVADIGQSIAGRRLHEAEALFSADGWKRYEGHLEKLSAQSQGAQPLIEDYFVSQMEARRGAIAEQQERIATAQSSSAVLTTKKAQLTDELGGLEGDRPHAATQVSQQAGVVANLERRLDEQRALTLAEERGVEGSGKEGRGKFWRASRDLERRIEAEIEVARQRLNSPRARLAHIDKRVSAIKAELAQIDGDIAKLTGVKQTAQQRISVADRSLAENSETEKVDPARVLASFEKAKTAFRQDPTLERLNGLHTQCNFLVTAMLSTPATKERVRGIDCDPKQASEAASNVFALNVGAASFVKNCAGGERLVAIPTTDGLFGFARQCLSDSGLGSAATKKLRSQINLSELNRDDKAHRFVVTWNAFQDGNRLAYLALAIAIAIDALVFMSGLFGANAVRSPLQDVPSLKPRSALQLESIVENALLPDKFTNAHATIDAMQPITPVDGFTQEVIVPFEETPHRARVLKVLNAGSAIGAVERDPVRPERYLVRPELFEFLSTVAKTCFEREEGLARKAELKQVVTVALQPYVGDHAEIVLDNMQPINERDGFTSEVVLEQVSQDDMAIVRNALNAGTTMNFAQQDERKGENSRYYIHKDLYKTIALIAATVPKQGRRLSGRVEIAAPVLGDAGAKFGGPLREQMRQLDHRAEVAAAAAQPARQEPISVSGGVSPAPGARPPAARQPAGEAYAVDPAELERYYRDDLFDALNLRRGADRELILAGDSESYQAAKEAWKALQERAGENRILADYILQFKQDIQDRIAERYRTLKAAVAKGSAESAAIENVRNRMNEAWPALMLHPEIGLVQSLIGRIEEAASNDGTLKPEEDDLRNRLNNALASLRADRLADAATWQRVESAIAEITPQFDQSDLPKVARTAAPSENVVPLKGHPNGTNG